MNIRQRDKWALAIAGIAVGCFLILQFAVFPVWDALQEQREKLPIQEKTLEKSQQVAMTAGSQTAAASSIEAKLREAEGGLLTSQTAALASAELQELIKTVSSPQAIDIRSSEFLPAKPVSPEYTLVPIGLRFQCQLDQLVGLLQNLEQSPKYLTVQRMFLDSGGSKQKLINVNLQIAGIMRAEPKKGSPK